MLIIITSEFFLLAFVCIGIGLFVLLISVGSVIVFTYRAKDKCHFFSCITNTCTFILGLANFILIVVLILFLGTNYTLFSLCDYSFQTVSNPETTNQVKDFFQEEIRGFLFPKCYEPNGLNLTEYIPINDPGVVSNLNEISTFLNGFSNYDNFQRVMSADRFNNGIQNVTDQWEVFRTGLSDNFYDVSEVLSTFNTYTLPCNETWVLNSQSCKTDSSITCKEILSNNTFEHERACITDSEKALETFDKLRRSFVSQGTLMKTMIDEIGEITSGTAHNLVSIISIRK